MASKGLSINVCSVRYKSILRSVMWLFFLLKFQTSMSEADDLEYVTKIVQQSEKFICGELAKLQRELKNCTQSLKVCETKMKKQDVTIQKLETELKVQDQKISSLQTEKQSLIEQVMVLQTQVDNPKAHSACKSAMEKAFTSALQSVLFDSNVPAMDTSATNISELQPLPLEPTSYIQVSSTPQQQVPAPDPPRYEAFKVDLGKRKFIPETSSTSE